MELRRPLDDRTSKRIESTIIRKEAPPIRNMEIKEAGNIGKALRELETPPARARDDRPRQSPMQDRLRIKEAGNLPLVEREIEEVRPGEGMTIAEILKEPEKTVEPEPSIETPVVEKASMAEPSPATEEARPRRARSRPFLRPRQLRSLKRRSPLRRRPRNRRRSRPPKGRRCPLFPRLLRACRPRKLR
jgi:hypothetical protein